MESFFFTLIYVIHACLIFKSTSFLLLGCILLSLVTFRQQPDASNTSMHTLTTGK